MNKIFNVFLWGCGRVYVEFTSLLRYDLDINILGIVSSNEEYYCKIDGYDVIRPERLNNFVYEYIIVTTDSFTEVMNQALSLGIPRKK